MSLTLYMDHNVRRALTEGLLRRGIDVITAVQDGMNETDDAILLNHASKLGRVLVREDTDFMRISSEFQKAGMHFNGVIFLSQSNASFRTYIDDIELVCEVYTPRDIANILIIIPL